MVEATAVVRANSASARVGNTQLIENIEFACDRGEWILLCGASGAGKTSLLRAVNGLQELSSGSIEVLGTRIPGRRPGQARTAWRSTGTVLQEVGLFESRSARANVELALRATGSAARSRAELARTALEQVGLTDLENRYPSELSAGQRQRVALARAFVTKPHLLVLDEPTSALDHKATDVVLDAIAALKKVGTAILMSSHRILDCAGICDRVIELDKGRITRNEVCRMLAKRPDVSSEAPVQSSEVEAESLIRGTDRAVDAA